MPYRATEVRRAPIGPGLWPGPRRQARWAGRGLQGQRRVPRSGMRSTVEAGGASPDNARRSAPGAYDIHPAAGARGACRPARPSSRSASPTVRYGGAFAAVECGASLRRAAARDGALWRKRKRARLPRHLRRESPASLAVRHGTAPLGHARRVRLARPSRVASWAGRLARRRCALEKENPRESRHKWPDSPGQTPQAVLSPHQRHFGGIGMS
jgi:hypothetical protein